MKRTAHFSPCGTYRYCLSRTWYETDFRRTGGGLFWDGEGVPRFGRGMLTFIGLNPSTANHLTDDQTIRKVVHIARREGYEGVNMLNLFALVSTDPALLLTHPDAVGPECDRILREKAGGGPVVFCWGAFPEARKREQEIIAMFPDALCLGRTKGGYPKHPCYLANATPLVPFRNVDT